MKREKIIKDLKKQLSGGKINQSKYGNRLWQFENIVQSQIENEVVKNIEKAHTYHFNLKNYRSNLSEEQIQEWKELLKDIKHSSNFNIQRQYQELKSVELEKGLQIIASFDPQNALSVDLVREYMFGQDKNTIEIDIIYKKLDEILKKGFQYPILKLKELIFINNEKIKPSKYPEIEFTILGVSNQIGVFVNEKLKGQAIKQTYYKVSKGQFCYNPYRINVGSIGLNENNYENQIISGAYNVFGCKKDELNPKYLEALFKTDKFLNYVKEKASGGVRMDFKIEYLQNWEIPVPPIEIQEEIVIKIEQQRQIIDGAYNITLAERKSRGIIFEDLQDENILLGDLIDTQYGVTSSGYKNGKIRLIRITDIDEDGNLIEENKVYYDIDSLNNIKPYKLERDDLLLVRTGATFGKVLFFNNQEPSIFASYLIRLKPKTSKFLPKFLWYFTFSDLYWRQVKKLVSGGTQPQFNGKKIIAVKMPLPSLNIQEKIIKKLDQQMNAIKNVYFLKKDAESKINEIIYKLWSN